MNRGDAEPRVVALKAEDDSMKALEISDPQPKLTLRDPVVTWKLLPENVGYVRILAEVPTLGGLFPLGDLGRAIEEMNERGARGLVLDVRGNQGGFDKLVSEMMSYFFDSKTVYEKVAYARDGSFSIVPEKTLFVEPREPHFSGPVVALVDDHTVSSGEGFPLMVRKLPQGHVVGFSGTQGSFGMAGASVLLPEGLEFGYPNGRSLDSEERIQVDGDYRLEGGIEPDVRIPIDEETVRAQWSMGKDVTLETALELIAGPAELSEAVPPKR